MSEKIGYFSKRQWVVLTWLFRSAAFLSIIGSSIIIYMILRRRKVRLALLHNRLIFAMSIIDVLNSLSNAVGPAAAPKEQMPFEVYGAVGNDATCAAQGFMFIFGCAIPCYNMCLCLYYLAVIRYNINQDTLAKYEKWMHCVSLLWPLAGGIFGVSFGLLQSTGTLICNIGEKENKLKKPWAIQSMKYSLMISSILILLIIFISMCSIVIFVRKQAIAMKKYQSFRNSQQRQRQNPIRSSNTTTDDTSNDTITQAFLYVASFVCTWTFPFFGFFIRKKATFGYSIVSSIFLPLQGLWNCIAFMRPRYIDIRKKNKRRSFGWVLYVVIFSSIEEEEAKKRKIVKKTADKYPTSPVRRTSYLGHRPICVQEEGKKTNELVQTENHGNADEEGQPDSIDKGKSNNSSINENVSASINDKDNDRNTDENLNNDTTKQNIDDLETGLAKPYPILSMTNILNTNCTSPQSDSARHVRPSFLSLSQDIPEGNLNNRTEDSKNAGRRFSIDSFFVRSKRRHTDSANEINSQRRLTSRL